jgi:hypothetical protein
MYFFMFRVVPGPEHPDAETMGGAYINCWIDRPTRNEAEAFARKLIEESHWIIKSLDKATVIFKSDYVNNKKGKECFEQALKSKQLFVHFWWPPE